MKITSDLTNLTTAILILTVQMFIEWTLAMSFVLFMIWVLYVVGEKNNMSFGLKVTFFNLQLLWLRYASPRYANKWPVKKSATFNPDK
jgi:hypothetical protein